MPQTECSSQNAKDQGLLSDNLGPMAKGPKNSAAVRSRQLIHASVPVKKFLAEKYNPVLWSLLIRLDLARFGLILDGTSAGSHLTVQRPVGSRKCSLQPIL